MLHILTVLYSKIMGRNIKFTVPLFHVIITIIVCILFVSCKEQLVVDSLPVYPTKLVQNPILNVFIENSGSMDGYMCDGSEFKDAVYSYVNNLNRYADTTKLFFINSNIIPYNNELSGFVKDLNPQSFRRAGGNRSNSDIGEMLEKIIKSVSDTTVSVFISDCILDLPQNAMNFLNIKKEEISNCIYNKRKSLPNLSVKILKMQSKFNGMYYYSRGMGNPERIINKKRPYYIWLIGTNNNLSFFENKVSSSEIKYEFMNEIAFSPYIAVPFEVSNKGQSKVLNAINGKYEILIKADFRPTLSINTDIENINNYQAYSPDVKVCEVRKITAESLYSHYIKVLIEEETRVREENIRFKTSGIPQWVIETNDTSGCDIKKNMNKTTGILSLIEGVADAYKEETINTNFKFSLKRN